MMADTQVPTTAQLARRVLLPAALIFVLPLFSLWFSAHALSSWDAETLADAEASIAMAKEMPEEVRAEQLSFVRAHSLSSICVSPTPEVEEIRAGLDCSTLLQFHWATRAAQASLALGLLGALVMALSTAAAFSRRSLQLTSLRFGWNSLQLISALQVILQGALISWLSFWITAEWFGIYIPKIIILVVIFAGLAVFAVVKAIFSRPDEPFLVEAEALSEADAPGFWSHLRSLAAQLDTAPPDNVLVGIDNNFFVTESDVTHGETTAKGRTLFVSLPLLRQLEQREADAVLVHELGHLLGGDTGHGKQLAPYLMRFDQYLTALQENPLAWPIFAFMRAYASLFHLALSKSRRVAELAADALAVAMTSAADLAGSLVKISAYSAFRLKTEDALLEESRHQQDPDLAGRLATGFLAFARSDTLKEALGDLDGLGVPHPFDSHPPISARLSAAGASITLEQVPTLLQREVRSTWIRHIPVAEAIESRLWAAYNARLASMHELMLAYRYGPDDAAEREHVERFFPPVTHASKEAGRDAEIDCLGVTSPDLDGPLAFEDVESAEVNERLLKRYLDVKLKAGREKKKQSICLSKLAQGDAFVADFERYLIRANAAREYRAEQAAEAQVALESAG